MSALAVRTKYEGLEIEGRLTPLYSGSLHYWRLEREEWPRLLDRVRELGFEMVCTCVPWSVHETARGAFDFGEKDPKKDLPAFLSLCRSKKLRVIVRPGPLINAELTYYGFPKRLFSMPDLLARTAEGSPAMVFAPPRLFPALCYASEGLYEESALYFDAFCQRLAPFLPPAGPVVAVQADNEMSMFFRAQPFDLDYAPASVALYQRFLAEKYESVDALNAVYGAGYRSFRETFPPREFRPERASDIPPALDWLAYREHYLTYGVARVAGMLRERGVAEVPIFHNFPHGGALSGFDLRAAERHADFAGFDFYNGRGDYAKVREASAALAAQSRLPFAPEFGVGGHPWSKPIFARDLEMTAPAAFMHGLKGVNFYMIVDRDRWCGAPISADGRLREEGALFFKRLLAFLKKREFHKFQIEAEAALASCRDYERLALACSLTDPLPFDLFGGVPPEWLTREGALPGLSEPVQEHYMRQRRGFDRGFARAGYPMMFADLEQPAQGLLPYRLIVAPTFEFMGAEEQQKLLVYALKGGALLIGPRAPRKDSALQPASRFTGHLLEPAARRKSASHCGLALEDVDLFEGGKPLFRTDDGEVFGYVRQAERGFIIHIGAVLPRLYDAAGLQTLAGMMRQAAELAGLRRIYPADDPDLETRVHRLGSHKILFVANPTTEGREAQIETDGGERFFDPFSEERFGSGGRMTVFVPPQSVRILENRSLSPAA